jgi:hypothetical protein
MSDSPGQQVSKLKGGNELSGGAGLTAFHPYGKLAQNEEETGGL